jgi:hypothetical protein
MTVYAAEAGQDLGNWARPGVPQKGWHCVGVTDLDEPSATCEMCQHQIIRYVHHMRHPDYPLELSCGCYCAGRMEMDHVAARKRERVLRNAGRRRVNWLRRVWRTSRRGNPYLNVDGWNVTTFRVERQDGRLVWYFRLVDRATERRVTSQQAYMTEDEAKLAAFDLMMSIKSKSTSAKAA